MKGEQHQVVVESLANSGDGVGRISNKVVFIPFSCPGDILKVEIIEDKKSFAKARIIEIVQASEKRRPTQCKVFGQCGGCDWQHIAYSEQLRWKQQSLVDVMNRVAGLEVNDVLSPIQASPDEFNYRNRIQLHQDKKGYFYLQKNSKKPVYIEQCPIASETINSYLSQQKIKTQKLGRKVEFAEDSQGKVDVFKVNQKGQSDLGFRQVNTKQNTFIAKALTTLVHDNNVKSVFDLYCGQGNWALSLADKLAEIQIHGIEINPINIQAAREGAPDNCHFILGDVLVEFPKLQKKPELIIIDPPRAGCDNDFLKMLCQSESSWLAYISCHPATLARDLKFLTSNNWELHSLLPVDMFPQTPHLESLAVLRSTTALKTANY